MLLNIWNWLFGRIQTVEEVLGVSTMKDKLVAIIDHHQTQIDVKNALVQDITDELRAHAAESTLANEAHSMLTDMMNRIKGF